jgi:hypothetical protein
MKSISHVAVFALITVEQVANGSARAQAADALPQVMNAASLVNVQ